MDASVAAEAAGRDADPGGNEIHDWVLSTGLGYSRCVRDAVLLSLDVSL
jgi:hypothetical protein